MDREDLVCLMAAILLNGNVLVGQDAQGGDLSAAVNFAVKCASQIYDKVCWPSEDAP